MFASPRPSVYSKRDTNKVGQPLPVTGRSNVLSQPFLPLANRYTPLFVYEVNNGIIK